MRLQEEILKNEDDRSIFAGGLTPLEAEYPVSPVHWRALQAVVTSTILEQSVPIPATL
jgi:hypothetical protein